MTVRRAVNGVLALAVLAACVVAGLALWDTTVPADLRLPHVGQDGFDAANVEQAEDYEAVARWLTLGSYVTLVGVLALYARHGTRLLRESAAGPIGTGFMLGILGFCLVWLVGLPFSLASFWWADRYDLVEVGYGEWIAGECAGLAGRALSISLVLLIVMGFARLVGQGWWLPAGALAVALSSGLAFVTPWLLPTLDRPPADVRQDARALARDTGLPAVDVRVEKVREWTNAPNAYAVGLGGSRKVVLWDTLVGDFPRAEVRVVLAHELGHHEHHHIAKTIWWGALFVFPAGIAVALVTRRRGGLAHPGAVPLALLVYVIAQLAFTPVTSAWSRRLESEADWAALNATKDPRAMEELFQGFTDEGLADPDPPSWWADVFDSHPSGAERVAMARAWQDRHHR